MVIYLKHPVHGTKVAVSDVEANLDMQNGWQQFYPGEAAPEPVPAPAVEVDLPAESVNNLKRRRRANMQE